MPNQFQFPRPKVALRQAARFPGQVLPAGIGNPITGALNTALDALPDIALPTGLPSLPLPTGMAGMPEPPTPKAFVQRAETVLPAGIPRMSSFMPDIALPKLVGPTGVGGYRETERTAEAKNGTVRGGGYRSI